MITSKSTTAKDQSPQSQLYAQGVQRLNLIGKYSKQLMHAYMKGFFDETSVSQIVLNNLEKSRILYRPDVTQSLKLRSDINKLISGLIEDERKRQINADVASQLEQIKTSVKHYIDALRQYNHLYAETHFSLLEEKVHDMTEQLENSIKSLWNKFNADFGFVSNLNDKIRETALAQTQTQHLLSGLKIINFDELIELTHNNPKLRSLLITKLYDKVADLHSSLFAVQQRFSKLMMLFREKKKQLQLISNMFAFLKQHPNFKVGDYPNRSNVPDIFNKAAPIIPSASIALDRHDDRRMLSDLIRSLKLSVRKNVVPLISGNDFATTEISTIVAEHQQLKEDVTSFFSSCMAENTIISALIYLHKSKLTWDSEIWLLQVIAEYESLSQDYRKYIKFNKKKKMRSIFNQLEIIQDIHLSFVI